MQTQDINVQKNSSSRFSFPTLPSHIVSPDEPVDVRVSVCTVGDTQECLKKFFSCGRRGHQCGMYKVFLTLKHP